MAELERKARELYKIAPVSSDYPVEVTLPGLQAKLWPKRLKKLLPWAIAVAGFSGISGASFAGYWAAFNAGHARQAKLEADNAALQDQLAQIKAVLESHDRRLKSVEVSEGAAMVVVGK